MVTDALRDLRFNSPSRSGRSTSGSSSPAGVAGARSYSWAFSSSHVLKVATAGRSAITSGQTR